MNKGIDLATGDVIAFLNSGDWYKENALNQVSENFSEDVDILVGRVTLYENNNILKEQEIPRDLKELRTRMIYCHQGIFARRNLFYKYGKFDEKYKIAADYDWVLRVCNQGATIKCIDNILVNYRLGGISTTKEANDEALKVSLDALDKMKKDSKIGIMEYENLKNQVIHHRQEIRNKFYYKQALYDRKLEETYVKDKIKHEFNLENTCTVFGCGKVGGECFGVLKEIGVEVKCFWDNEKSRWGTIFKGVNVCNPQNICTQAPLIIIASTKYEEEIKKQIESMGLREKENYVCYSDIRHFIGNIMENCDRKNI